MITQAFKRWLRTMFAWWPWKRTPPLASSQASGPLTMNTSQEGISRSSVEGTTSQTSITPRLSTIEERPERTSAAQKTVPSDKAESDLLTSSEPPAESAPSVSAPTPEQRLEFLRYLVKRGIVNEGFEET